MQSVLALFAVLGIGSIVAAIISWRVAIANHRQAWINGLRDDLAAFLKELETIHRTDGLLPETSDRISDEIEREKREARAAILFAHWRILFRLNRTEPMHAELRRRLDDLVAVERKGLDKGKVSEAVDLARQILKQEWSVTKYGILTKPVLWLKSRWGSNSHTD